jgi:LPXTG-motif cell wall-anchored protein
MAPHEQSRSTERASRVTTGPEASPRQRRLRVAAAAALVAAIGSATLVMAAAPSGATGFAVTTTADGGTGSLRAALDQANAHPGPDLISLPAGTYTLALAGRGDDANLTGDLDVLDDVLIVGTAGTGATTIDGAGLDRVFDVVGGSLSVQGLTITGGDPGVASLQHGGGIRALGHPVTVLDSVLTANTAHEGGGVYADSTTASFQRSEIVDNLVVSQPGNGSEAGGLDMRGTVVTISDSTIAGNESVLGNSGGIDFIGSPATITNSTISGNKAGNRGGGMSVGGPDSVLTIRHTTFAENSAAGDSGAGGAFVMRGGSVSLQNTLFWMNSTPQAVDRTCGRDFQFPGTLTSAGGNLADDTTCDALTLPTDQNGDAGTMLGPLAANGGPTRTRALLAGSSAVDAAPCTGAVTTDQRSFGRPAGLSCDVGAYELAAVALPTTTTTTAAPTTTTTQPATTTSTAAPTTTTASVLDHAASTDPDGVAGAVAEPGTLPVTGSNPMSLVLLAGGFLILGLALLATSRRRGPLEG